MIRIQDFHLLWFNFPGNSTSNLQPISQSYNPNNALTLLVWAIPFSLATTQGITIVFFSSGYLDVSVLRVCLPTQVLGFPFFKREGFPIRKSSDQRLFAPSRSLSQLITSFIASESQGIHHTLLITFLSNCNLAMLI